MSPSVSRLREPGIWLSVGAHGGLLLAALVTFTANKLPDAVEGIPVEVLTDSQFSEITRGEVTAAKVQPVPSPRVDRVAETRVERDPGEAKQDVPSPPKRPVEAKVADEEVPPAVVPPARPQPEAKVAEAAPPPPAPRPIARPEPAKPDAAKAEAIKLAEREAAEEAAEKAALAEKAAQERAAKAERDARLKAEADAKAKAEADAKAKAEAQARKALAEAKAAKAKAEAEAKARKQAELAETFDAGNIAKLLASKDPAQSQGSSGRELQRTASLGAASGTAQRLNPSQRDQIAGIIREQLIRCWQPPVAVQSAARPPTATVRLALGQDGRLLSDPAVMNSSSDPLFRPIADSALRATRRCAPLKIPDKFTPFYNDWKDLLVDFNPRELG